MGKKKYPTKQFTGGWGDSELIQRHQQSIITSSNPAFKGSKRLLEPIIKKKSARTLEEESFLEELRQEDLQEQMLAREEAQLKFADKVNKLSNTQMSVVDQIVKNKKAKGLTDEDIASDKEINNYIDKSNEYNKIRKSDKFLQDEEAAKKELEDATGFWNNVKAGAKYGFNWFKTGTQNAANYLGGRSGVGNTQAEKDKYNKISKELSNYEKPIIEGYISNIDSQLEKAKNVYNKIEKGNIRDRFVAQLAIDRLNNKKEFLNDHLTNNTGLFAGIDNKMTTLISFGLDTLAYDVMGAVAATNVRRRGENSLTEADKVLLESRNLSDTIDGSNFNKDEFLYRTGQGTTESAAFMAQMMATQGSASAIGKGVSVGAKSLANRAIASVFNKALTKAEGSFAAKALETLAVNGTKVANKTPFKIIGDVAEIGTQSAMMPGTYSLAGQHYIGNTQLVEDADGTKKVLVSEAGRRAYEKEAKAIISEQETIKRNILAKGNKMSEADKIRLQEVEDKIQNTSEMLNSIYVKGREENGIQEDSTVGDALIHGYTENLKETWSEKFVGKFLDTNLGKVNRLAGKSNFSRNLANKLENTALNKAFKAGNKALNKLGSLSSSLAAHSGGAKIFNSLPSEIGEEIAIQLLPTYKDNWRNSMEAWGENVSQLLDPTFYMDVAAQTLLMSGGPTMIGTAGHLTKYAADPEYRKEYRANRDLNKEVRNIYKQIDNSVNDDQLAELISMKSGNTLFNVNEYRSKVNELREQGKEAEADKLEKRSFMNLAANAMKTGTLNQFERTLSGIASSKDFSDETKRSAMAFASKIKEFKKIEEEHSDKINYNNILNHSINNLFFKDTIEELNKTIGETKAKAQEFIDLKKEAGLLPQEFTLESGNFANEIMQDIDLNSLYAQLGEESVDFKKLLELQYTKDVYTESYFQNLAKLNYELDPKNQEKIRKEINEDKKKALEETTDNTTLNTNKKEVVTNPDMANGEVDKVVKTTDNMDTQAYNKELADQNPQTDITVDPNAPTTLELPKEEADKVAAALTEAGVVSEEVSDEDFEFEEETPLNAPMGYQGNDTDKKKVEALKGAFTGTGTLGNILGAMANTDAASTDRLFDHIIEAHNQVRPNDAIDKESAKELYESMFGNAANVSNALKSAMGLSPSNTMTTSAKVETPVVTQPVVDNIESNTTANESVAIDIVSQQPVVVYRGYKTITPDVKLAHISNNVETIGENGESYKNITNVVNESSFPAIHYENFKPGDKVTLTFDWGFFDTDKEIYTYTQKDDGSVDTDVHSIEDFVIKVFGPNYYSTFRQKLETEEGRQELLQNKEFLNYMPTTTILADGTNTGLGINSMDWWNTKNVGLEQNNKGEYLVGKQKQIIEKAKARNNNLRQSLAQGNKVELTVSSRKEGFHNKLLEDDANKFNSIVDSFGGNTEAMLENVGFGAIKGDVPASYINSDDKVVVTIGNKEVILTEDNSNIKEFKDSMAGQTGKNNGRPFMVYQVGYNEKGNPQYAVRAVVTNHASKNKDFQTQLDIKLKIVEYGQIAIGAKEASPATTEKAKKIWKMFKDQFNIDISSNSDITKNFTAFYPDRIKIPDNRSLSYVDKNGNPRKYYNAGDKVATPNGEVTIDNPLKQDFFITNKANQTIPDITGFESLADFESKVLKAGTIPTTTAKEVFAKNTHTQYIFSEISSENNAPIWTTEIQPKITFSDGVSIQEKQEERQQEIQTKALQLEGNRNLQERVQERIENVEDPLEKERLEKEQAQLKEEEKALVNQLAAEGITETTNLLPKSEEVVEEERDYDSGDIHTINEHIMYSTLFKVRSIFGKNFTADNLYNEAVKTFDEYVEQLRAQEKQKEVDFLLDNRNQILSLEQVAGNDVWSEANYDGSVIEMINTLYEIDANEGIDFSSQFIKDQNKDSTEVDISLSLSQAVKMMFAGIKDSRANTKDSFGNLPSYLTFKDSISLLQLAFSEIPNNNLEDLKVWINNKVELNPQEFEFYNEIYERLSDLKNTDEAFLNEIMYFLHQPKVTMTMMMFSESEFDGSFTYTVQKFDANSKNPEIAKRAKWNQTLRTSPLIKVYEQNLFTINNEAFEEVKKLYESIKADRDAGRAINHTDLNKYFEYFGIKLNSRTLQALDENLYGDNDFTLITRNEGEQSKGILSSNQIFENLFTNLNNSIGWQNQGVKLSLTKNISEKGVIYANPLIDNTSSSLKRLVAADNAVSVNNPSAMRIAGKSINPFQQASSLTNTINKLKSNPEFIEKLKSTQITSTSMLLEMLESNPDFREYFKTGLVSLEAIKRRDSDSKDDMGPTQISDMDAMVTLLNMFAQDDGKLSTQPYEDKKIKLRKGTMVFPTLSDASRVPTINTVLIDLSKENFNDLEMDEISSDILDIVIDKAVRNELRRIAAFLSINQTTNIKGHDAGAVLINSLPSLNTVLVETTKTDENGEQVTVTRPLIEVFKNYNNSEKQPWRDDIESFIEQYKEQIYNEIRDNINHERDKVLSQFVTNDIAVLDLTSETPTIQRLSKIDNKYLKSKGSMSAELKAKLIATDYVLNNLLTLNDIHNIFAGDTANYFKDKHTKDFQFGMPKVTISDLANYYYPGQLTSEDLSFITDNYFTSEEVRAEISEKYPMLLSSSEIAMNETTDERIKNITPVARLKMVDIYSDVQNNLAKRLKALISPGNQYPNSHNSDQKYYQIMLQDVESASEVLHSLAKQFHPEVYEQYKDKINKFKELDDIYESNRTESQAKEHDNLKKELGKNLPQIKGFLATASTDAQEYATWQDNLNQLRNQGRITQEEFNVIFDKLTAQAKDIDDVGYIRPENKWKPEEKDLQKKSIMQVTKPLYSGNHLETIKNDSGEYNYSRYIYIKSSSFPLTPELTVAFPKLNNLRKNLEKWQEINPETRQIQSTIRVSYDSANKVGAAKKGLSINELYKTEPDLGLIGQNTVELNKENFFIQQDKPLTPEHKMDYTTRATQFEKILLGDGINKIEEHIFPNIFDKELIDEMGIELVNDKLNGPQLKQLYDELYRREQQLLTDKFNRELGINDINDIAQGNPIVYQNLIRKLKQRLTNKQDLKSLELSYEVRYYSDSGKKVKKLMPMSEFRNLETQAKLTGKILPVIERAHFKLPLYMMPNSNKFESVLNSLINKSNVNLKLPGFATAVGSQEGFDFKGYTEEEYKSAIKNGLITTKNFDPSKGLQATRNEDGTLKFAQVFIANKFKVLDKETGKYKYVDLTKYVDENNQIDTSKLPEELLSMFSFRIPTSSHQSGVIIEVAGFLPSTSGSLMVVPKDHTVQIGEDYDIDMRYIYQYHFIQDGDKLKKLSYSDIERPDKTSKELRTEYELHRDKLWRSYYQRVSNVDQNDPLAVNPTVNQINPLFEQNKNTFEELFRLEEALENYELDRYFNVLFEEQYEVEEVTKDFLRRKIAELEEQIIPKELIRQEGQKLKEEYKVFKDFLKESYTNEKSELGKAWIKYNNSISQQANEEKVLQNNLIALYKSVFSSDNTEVQNLINKTLSTDNAEDTAKEMSNKINSNDKSPYYTFNSPSLQRDVLKLGASGKIGIGEHSNAVTMNSIFQQSNFEHQIFDGYEEIYEKGELISRTQKPFHIILGNQVFNGTMGKVSNNGVRGSELAMEDQNSATDNQKLQIMGRRNEDKNTMGVLKILHASIIDNDGTIVTLDNGNTKTLSYASLFINQPILREYSALVNKYSSVTSNVKGNAKKKALEELKSKLISQIMETGTPELLNFNSKGVPTGLDISVYQQFASQLDSQFLYDNLIEGGSLAHQLAILENFEKLQRASETYNELQRLVNIESDGMGISYFNTIDNMENLMNVLDGKINITNSDKMFGDYLIANDISEVKEGYVPVITKDSNTKLDNDLWDRMKVGQTLYVKPNNHFSHKAVNSIALGYNTYNSIFPYNNNNIKSAIKDIMDNLGISKNSAEAQKMKYKIIADLKDFIYTSNSSLFGGDINKARKDLFFEDENHESLATYMLKLSNNSEFTDLFRLPFFRDLTFEINDSTYPSMIKFNNSDISKINTLAIYNNFDRMMKMNRSLPQFNGKKYDYKSLMRDLLKYSLLADQAGGAIGFRQHLPIELFEKYGVMKGVNSITSLGNNFQAIAYHGVTKSLENIAGSKVKEDGTIIIDNENLTLKDINILVRNANNSYKQRLGIENMVSYDKTNNKLILSNFDNKRVHSLFAKQFLQHNADNVVNLTDDKVGRMLSSNGFTREDLNTNKVKSFHLNSAQDFLTIRDGNNKLHLYEKVDENFYQEIPILGTFGLKEYNTRNEQQQSNISKNNVIHNSHNLTVSPANLPSMFTENKTANLQELVNNLMKDTTGPYSAIFRLFKEFVQLNNVEIKVGKVSNYKARYYPSGKVEINPRLLEEGADMNVLAKAIAEEMIHHITVNTVGEYITFTGFNPETQKVTYTINENEDGTEKEVPSEIISLVAVYNHALKTIINKNGIEAVTKAIEGNDSYLNAEDGTNNENYRVSNIHEFLAGIFFKDEQFAQLMADTPYRNGEQSIREKFLSVLLRFFNRIIPSFKKETVSGEVLVSLTNLLDKRVKEKNTKIIKSVFTDPVKNKEFTDSLKLIKTLEQQLADKDMTFSLNEMDDVDNMGEFPTFEAPEELKGKFDGTRRAGKQAIRDVYEKTFDTLNTNNNTSQPNSTIPVANIPQNLVSGQEAFGTLQHATPEIKAILGENPTSIDMIEAGLRTRTTRSVGEMKKYNIKVGDIIKHFGKSADGSIKNINARVTAIHYKGTPEFESTWYKEGWTQEGLKSIQRYKDGAAAIEFEIINDNNQEKGLNSPMTFSESIMKCK